MNRLRFASMPVLLAMATIAAMTPNGQGACVFAAEEKREVTVSPSGRWTGFPDWVMSIDFAPDGHTLAAGSYEVVRLFHVAEKKTIRELAVGGYAQDVTFSPDGSQLAIAAYQSATIVDVATGETIHKLPGHRGYVLTMRYSPDGSKIATACEDEAVRIFDLADLDRVVEIRDDEHELPMASLSFSPDGKHIATASGDPDRVTRAGVVRVWDAQTGEAVAKLPKHAKAAADVAFSPNGRFIVSTGYDERCQIFDFVESKAVGFFGGHSRPTTRIVITPDSKIAVTGSGGRAKGHDEIKVWNVQSGQHLATIEGHQGRVTDVALSSNGTTLASASLDRSVAFWTVSGLVPAATKKATKELRAGIIGLDTSHSTAFAGLLNAENPPPELAGCRVVAAYPHGSADIESSVSRIPKYTEDIKKLGVEVVGSIDELLTKVDVVFLETNDGRPHLEQVLPVLKAGKTVFVDKPIAASLADAIAIFEASKRYKVPVFSSSSLRYSDQAAELRNGKLGTITKCETHSPCSIEPTHPDLFWYGIHGVELLFTVMGTGCESVQRTVHNADQDEVVGQWKNDRVGTFRGYRKGGPGGYGGKVVGTKGEGPIGNYRGYGPLLVDIVKFFRSGKSPVADAETLEIYAFMAAADESKRNGGKSVRLDDVMKAATEEAMKRLNELDPPKE